MFDYGSDTYKALTKIIKLRFGKELKDSGLELKGLYSMRNLVNDKKFFLLEVNNQQIRFTSEKMFLLFFADFLRKNIKELDNRYKRLINRPTDEFSDEVGIEMEYKLADYYSMKQNELLKKINKYQEKLKKNEK